MPFLCQRLRFPILKTHSQTFISQFINLTTCNYDLVVVGTEPGGIAAATEASILGATVAVVAPDENHRKSIPNKIYKKLSHHAAMLGEALRDSVKFGWQVTDINHNWDQFRAAINQPMNENIDLQINIKGAGHFQDNHNFMVTSNSQEYHLKSKYFLINVGSVPRYPNLPGTDLGTPCSDVFNLQKPPGRTLIVGGGSTSLEAAGILNAFGCDVTVITRSSPLKELDQQMVDMVLQELMLNGITFFNKSSLQSLSKVEGKIEAKWLNHVGYSNDDLFDTVLFAIGNRALTEKLHLEEAGIVTLPDNNKILSINNQTNIENIFAIGDVVYGQSDSTNIIIQSGRLLAKKLFGEFKDFNTQCIPRSIYTPLGYSYVGLTEHHAKLRYGDENIEVYHSFFKPIEFSITKRNVSNCYLKVIALKTKLQEVVGMHYIGPHAEEIIQGFSVAMNCNLTIETLMNTIGIHPTLAEEFTRIFITKRSGRSPIPASCCS